MADYTIRVIAESDAAEKKVENLNKNLRELKNNSSIKIQIPSMQDTIAGVQKLGEALKTTYAVARNVPIVGQRLQDAEYVLQGIATSATKARDGLVLLSKATPGNILAESFNSAASAANSFNQNLARVGFTIFGVTQSVNLLRAAYGNLFDETIGREVKLQETLLRTRTSLVATSKVIADGKAITDPYKALIALDKPIEKIIGNIRKRSLDIAGTTSEAIIDTFGMVANQISNLGGSLKDAEDLAISFAAALGTLGLSDPYYARQEVGSVLRGDIDNNSILARTIELRNEDLAKAKAQGKAIEYLQERLQPFIAGQKIAAQGFRGLTSNIQEFSEEFKRAFGAPILDPINAGLTVAYTTLAKMAGTASSIADAMGRMVAVSGAGLFGAVSQAPVLGGGGEALRGADAAASQVVVYIQQAVDQLAPTITQLTNSVLSSIASISTGLIALAKGLAMFKFEQFKLFLGSLSNIASLLSSSVIPLLTQVLKLYGAILEQPLAQYISQVGVQFALLERIGVMPFVRIAYLSRGIIESLQAIAGWVKTVADAIGSGITAAFNFVTATIAGFSGVIVNTAKSIVSGVLTGIRAVIKGFASLAISAQVALLGIAETIQSSYPQYQMLIGPLLAASKAFGNLGLAAMQSEKVVTQSALDMIAAIQKLQLSVDQVRTNVNAFGAAVGNKFKQAGAAVGNFIMTQVKGFASFMLQMYLVQVAVAVVTDAITRFTKKLEESSAQERAQTALRRLETTYKDVGESSSLAARKLKEFEESIVSSRVEELVTQISKIQDELEQLQEFNAEAGINSWSEAMYRAMQLWEKLSDFNPVVEDLKKVYDMGVKVFTFWGNVFTEIDRVVRQVGKGFVDLQTAAFNAFVPLLPLIQPLKLYFDALGIAAQTLGRAFGTLTLSEEFKTGITWIDRMIDRINKLIATIKPLVNIISMVGPNPFISGAGIVGRVRGAFSGAPEDAEAALRLREAEARGEIANLTDRQATEQREQDIRTEANRRVDLSKQIRDIERQHKDAMFQLEQQIGRSRIEATRLEGELRIRNIDKANAKVAENERGLARTVLERVNQYISTKLKGELDIESRKKELTLELQELEKTTVDYKFEMEKRIAELRKQVSDHEAKMAQWKVDKAKEEAQARNAPPEGTAGGAGGEGFMVGRVGRTGDSTGFHLDGRWGDLRPITVADLDKYLRVGGKKPSEWTMTSPYGPRNLFGRTFHHGVDIGGAGIEGAPVTLTGGARLIGSAFSRGGGQQANLMTPEGALNLLHLIEKSVPGVSAAAQWGGGAGSGGTSAKQAQAMRFFMGRGLNQMQAAALVGGLMQESTVNLRSDSINPKSGTEGIAQWKDSRRLAMISSGARNNFAKQLEFLWSELQGSENASLSRLKSADTLNEALMGSASFFRFKDWNKGIGVGEWGNRAAYTKQLLGMPVGAPGRAPAGAAGSAPQLDLSVFDKMSPQQAALTKTLMGSRQRINDLQTQITQATTKDAFENITKGLFPEQDLKGLQEKTKFLQEDLKILADVSKTVFDKDKALAQAALNNELTTNNNLVEISIKGLTKLQGLSDEERKKIEKDLRDKAKAYEVTRRQIFAEEQRQKTLQQAAAGIADINREIQQLGLATTEETERMRQQMADLFVPQRQLSDPLFQRQRQAEISIAARRRRIQTENPELLGQAAYVESLDRLDQATRNSATELGTLEKQLLKISEKAAMAREFATAITDGFKQVFVTALSGGDINEAMSSFSQSFMSNIFSKVADYAFKPFEQKLEQVFRDLFGVTDPEAKAQTAHTVAMERHAAALNGVVGAPGVAATPMAPGFSPENAFNNIVPFGTAVEGALSNFDPSVFTDLSTQFQNVQFNADSMSQSFGALVNVSNAAAPAAATAVSSTQRFVGSLAMVATSVMGIVSGIQQMGKGGTGNFLTGLSSTLLSVGGLFMGNPFGVFGRASGGQFSSGRPYLFGENGPELAIPSTSGRMLNAGTTANLFASNQQAMDRLRFRSPFSPEDASEGAVLGGKGSSPFVAAQQAMANSLVALEDRERLRGMPAAGRQRLQVDYFKVQDLDVITRDQFEAGLLVAEKRGAERGQARVTRDARKNPAYRQSLGL